MKKIAANLCAGFRVGKLTVERPTEAISSGNAAASVAKRIFWIPALCRGGAILDCGCNTVVKPGQRDITGMRFGMLVALRRPANRKRMSVPFGTAAVTAAVRLLVSPVFDEVVLPGLLV